MCYVYILESKDGRHFYVGFTMDLRVRLKRHNAGRVPHTSKHLPWRLKTYLAFSSAEQAQACYKSKAFTDLAPARDKAMKVIRLYVVETVK